VLWGPRVLPPGGDTWRLTSGWGVVRKNIAGPPAGSQGNCFDFPGSLRKVEAFRFSAKKAGRAPETPMAVGPKARKNPGAPACFPQWGTGDGGSRGGKGAQMFFRQNPVRLGIGYGLFGNGGGGGAGGGGEKAEFRYPIRIPLCRFLRLIVHPGGAGGNPFP